MKNETELLDEAILVAEKKRAMAMMMLKAQWHTTYEAVRPVNLIKNSINEIVTSSDIQGNVLSSAVGIGMGIAAKKLWVGNSESPVKRMVGTLLQFAVAHIVKKQSGNIQSAGKNILEHFGKEIGAVNDQPEREINY
jgi:hypothetical protein